MADAAEAETEAESEEDDPPLHSMRPIEDTDVAAETVTHSVVDILRARMLAIPCGYENADDLDHLRSDPGFRLACGRLVRGQ